jgi:hypothetical protein
MMQHSGLNPVEYYLTGAVYPDSKKKSEPSQEKIIKSEFTLNSVLGKTIKLEFNGEIRCVDCGKVTKKSFNQGSCFKCFQSLASNDFCIMKPETCHYHLGTCREPKWGEENCFKKHTVYIANTSGVKIGITKENPVTKRWVDQGAMYAIPVFEVESRINAGKLESEYAKFISDKTAWQTMISTDSTEIDLYNEKKKLFKQKSPETILKEFKEIPESEMTQIQYPILRYPKKKKSLNPEKDKLIKDILVGIKGQYLLFENGVINLRSYSGYYFEFEIM